MEDKKDDEEISVDFSKIKGWFSKKGEQIRRVGESTAEPEEKIDLGKVKDFFKRSGESESGEEYIDFKKIKESAFGLFRGQGPLDLFFRRYGLFLIVMVPLILAIFLRVQPAYLPMTDDWAENAVYKNYKGMIGDQIRQQYPNLPDQNINSLVEREFENFLKNNKDQVERDIQGTSNYFKSRFQDVNGDTYLSAIDPWFWLRHARNILNKGHPGDELRNGRPYDTFMNAPIGRYVPADMFHAYFIAGLYKFFAFFNPDVTPMRVSFFIPALISALAVIPAFFVARRTAGNFGGFIAGLIVGIHPAFLSRTMGGFSDTDAYNVFFPLLITWLFMESMDTKSLKARVALTVLNGFFVGVYAFAWSGWWYIFDYVLAAIACYIGYYTIVHWDEVRGGRILSRPGIKNSLIVLILFFVVSGIFVAAFANYEVFYKATVARPIGFTKIKEVGITTVWPNVFTTVAEQSPASLNSVINQTGVGSLLLVFLALVGIVLTLVKGSKDKNRLWYVGASSAWYLLILIVRPQNLLLFLALICIPIALLMLLSLWKKETLEDIKLAILLVLWFVSTVYASTKGIRFGILIVPAFALSLGIAFGILTGYLSRMASNLLNVNRVIAKTAIVLVFLSLLFFPVNMVGSAYDIAQSYAPSMVDGWYESLDQINREADRDSIITSWWDFGHWFKYIGNRPVTFDGTSQNTPPAHWVGKILSISNEKKAIGILRMLHCGANTAHDILFNETKDTPYAVDILNEIFALDKEDARKVLVSHGLSEEKADEVLQVTHCDPPEAYFIASDDMIGKSGVWAHFGNWNFDRALMYNTLRKSEYRGDFRKGVEFLMKRFNMTEQRASNYAFDIQNIQSSDDANNWIAPWPNYQSGQSTCRRVSEGELECDVGQGIRFMVNLGTLDASVMTNAGVKHPNSLWLATRNGMEEKRFNDSIGISLVVYPDGNNYRSLAISPEIAGGMFTRMFFLDGHSLRYFKLFSQQMLISGGKVNVFKVDWKGSNMTVMEEFVEKPAVESLGEGALPNATVEAVSDMNITGRGGELEGVEGGITESDEELPGSNDAGIEGNSTGLGT